MDKDSGADGYVQTYDGNTWSVFDNTLADENDYMHTDYMTMDIDPKNSRRIMVGSKNGLFEYIDGKMTRRFNSDNTENLVGGDNTVIVSMAYDDSGNLWMVYSPNDKRIARITVNVYAKDPTVHCSAIQRTENGRAIQMKRCRSWMGE